MPTPRAGLRAMPPRSMSAPSRRRPRPWRPSRSFDRPLPEQSSTAESVIAELDELGSPATMATTGGRFFGFVTGGALPVTVAANWLATAWDQNAAMVVTAPVNAQLEIVAARWLTELLGLPAQAGCGFVTCATTANFAALAAARHALLARAGLGRRGAGPVRRAAADRGRGGRGPFEHGEGPRHGRLRASARACASRLTRRAG